jgi:hypothetical protein
MKGGFNAWHRLLDSLGPTGLTQPWIDKMRASMISSRIVLLSEANPEVHSQIEMLARHALSYISDAIWMRG